MRLLLIEDERKIARALKRAFEHEHYAVDLSFDSDDGLAMATTEPYDVMIIDRMLPGSTDGIGIISAIRNANIHTPVLLLTALSQTSDITAGLDSGADDYLTKPFDLEELLARVRALIRRPVTQQPTVLSAGDLELNPATAEVQRCGDTITLTAKEFSLLEYLLRNQNRPVSKDMIIEHVWDFDATILPNTVEVYIRYLREKIDKPYKKTLIHTVRGFGYKLAA